ncbi:carboxypeptidase-like regulatory domain-containing protein [Psychroflexus aestuariivivens]|uniref:carboxypeptidase-like regulatory domain-containing protein n=1 Tax=Psychroflexus aestuariivivens TaxID=1795040 RepID=UPI000FDCA4DE|nr:carboxypeptidase-like regulatory domain-containing protein [Psychroflexus aestuariivivens]
MKFIFTSLCLLLFQFSFAQIDDRVYVAGKVNVPPNGEVKGIEIYNQNSEKGTVTNKYGQFGISVKVDDKLTFKAVQYQTFSVIVDENIVKNKKMDVTIKDEVNTLEEVIVQPYDLDGNIEVDAKKVKENYIKSPVEDSDSVVRGYAGSQPNPRSITINENITTEQRFIKNGLNIANIFREIFQSNETSKNKRKLSEDADVMVRKIYNDEFFKKHLDIEEDEINNFIFYVEDRGLDKKMLKEGNELELIEFLIKESKNFKNQ